MFAKLFCKTGALAGCEFFFTRDATIGSGPSNTIVLASRTVSGEHARIALDERGRFVLTDVGSQNGTKMDGRPVKGAESLGDLHVITFADHDFIFHVSASDTTTGLDRSAHVDDWPVPVDSGTASPPAIRSVVPEGLGGGGMGPETSSDAATVYEAAAGVGAPSWVGLHGAAGLEPATVPEFQSQGPAVAQLWYLEVTDQQMGVVLSCCLVEGAHCLGRGVDCELRIDDRTLSREHALLTVRDGQLTISDLGSANGTFADGVRIQAPVDAREGMKLRFAELTATLVRRAERESSEPHTLVRGGGAEAF